jgi:hypothetical protein
MRLLMRLLLWAGEGFSGMISHKDLRLAWDECGRNLTSIALPETEAAPS